MQEEAVWPGDVKIGIGINSGLCCVGNMGSRQRLSYSLIGDTVNVASRLEGLTKQYGVPIITGSDLAAHLTAFALLELDLVKVVGRETPETIFALLGDEDLCMQPVFKNLSRIHSDMLGAYRRQDWGRAGAELANGQTGYEALGISGLQDLFRARIAGLREHPPGENWDGVFQATEK